MSERKEPCSTSCLECVIHPCEKCGLQWWINKTTLDTRDYHQVMTKISYFEGEINRLALRNKNLEAEIARLRGINSKLEPRKAKVEVDMTLAPFNEEN